MSKRQSSAGKSGDTTDPEHELIGRRDAAELVGVHYNTIRLWEGQGLIAPRKVMVGRRQEVRYDRAEVLAAAEHQAEKRNAPPPGSTALELPTDRLWEMVQEAAERAAQAEQRAAESDATARARAEELERLERRHAAQLAKVQESKAQRTAEAEARARAAEQRAADLQAALVELAKPTGWFLFRRRPIVVVGAGADARRELGAGEDVIAPTGEVPQVDGEAPESPQEPQEG